jgi:hypothetical protein
MWSYISREKAQRIAEFYIPTVEGAYRNQWINGFLDFPPLREEAINRSSAASKLRAQGVMARREWEKAQIRIERDVFGGDYLVSKSWDIKNIIPGKFDVWVE